jgi:hypothetical protein
MMRLFSVTTALLFCILRTTVAFAPVVNHNSNKPALFALSAQKRPAFDKQTQKWQKMANDDGTYPYDAIGSLLRHGPAPFITRITNPSLYEQQILKYMATDRVSRAEATGNMDAKMNNAMDWMYQKAAEKKGAPKVDYTELKKKDAALVIIWAFGITPLAISVVQQTVSQF